MMKNLLSAIIVAAPFLAFAQNGSTEPTIPLLEESLRVNNSRSTHVTPIERGGGGSIIWSEDFQNGVNSGSNVITSVGTWTKDGVNGEIWKHSFYTSSGCYSEGTPVPSFTTVANGFLLFDADSANCIDPNTEPPTISQDDLTGYVLSPTIDLSANNAILLEFEYQNRWCCTEAVLTVDISTDNGVTFPNSLPIPVNPTVNEEAGGLISQNISNFAGGQSQVKLRFSWNGVGSHYYLAIDDIAIVQAATDDLKLQWDLVSHNETIEEYARFSMDQAQNTIQFGASIENFGSSIASNVTMLMAVLDVNSSPVYVGSTSQAILLAGDTTFLILDAPVNLQPGIYTANFTITSDGEQSGSPNFGDNTNSRTFEVSDAIYCLDGIGVHPAADLALAQLSTASFTDAEDGFMIFSHNDINASVTATGVQVELSIASVVGGLIVASLHDSTDIGVDDVYSPLVSSTAYALTATDITTGIVDIPFTMPFWVSPGQYYAGVELFSNGNSTDVGILDDITIPQPFWSSMIYIPNDQVYSNGNAMAVRLMTDLATDNGIENASTVFNVYPNPANDVVSILSNEDGQLNILDVNGRIVLTESLISNTRLNVSTIDLPTGVYQINLITDRSSKTEKLIVSH
jgi:hypothetical protein